jgi:hypothetical protein
MMKIAMRMLVVTLVLAGSVAGKSLSGPGPEPAPPVAVNF